MSFKWEYKKRLAAESGEPLAQQYSGIIFSGNPHETVPRRLLLDKRLTPLDIARAVKQMAINQSQGADGVRVYPEDEPCHSTKAPQSAA